jgi:uncharacterized protein (TIGR03382 family)
MRNNIIANCTDVGIYLNRGKDSHILYNTLVGTSGIDFRFDTTSGEAVGNVLTGSIRTRDNATMTASLNMESVATTMFAQWYRQPLTGDLHVIGDVSSLVAGGPARTDVLNDYCGVIRPTTMIAVGAIEHSVQGCETVPPPHATDPTDPGSGDAGPNGGGGTPSDGGCCDASGDPALVPLALGVLVALRRRRRLR